MPIASHTHVRGWMSFPITGQVSHAATEAGSVGFIKNPEDVPIIITDCIVYGITNSDGACNLTIGHATTVIGGHDTTQLFAAAAQAAAEGTAVTGLANGDAADALPVVPAGSYICAFCSADSTGLAAIAYVNYLRAEEVI